MIPKTESAAGARSMRVEIEAAARALKTDIRGLARRLEISVGSLRSWSVRGGPVYARLALAALVLGIDPDKTFHQDSNTSSSRGAIGEPLVG